MSHGARVGPIAPFDHGGLDGRGSADLVRSRVSDCAGSVDDSYDNALAGSIIGLYKTEVIRPRGPWRGLEAVEFATLEWVDWFNNRRLLEVIGNRPPAEAEAAYHRQREHTALAA